MAKIKQLQIDENIENSIFQQNDLVRAQPFLNLNEYRVFKSILALVRDGDADNCVYQLDIAVFKEIFDLKGGSVYEIVRNSLNALYEKSLRKEYLENNKKCTAASRLISSFVYKEGDGFATISIPPPIHQLATGDSNFNEVKLEMLAKLKCTNHMKLYEILNSWKNQIYLQISVNELKEQMDLSDKYERSAAFLKKVVFPAVEAINEKTDLFITYTSNEKKGLKAKLTFTIKTKEQINEKKQSRFLKDSPLDIFIWENLWLKVGDDNYIRLLNLAEEIAPKYRVDPRYYLHYYLCYADQLAITPLKPYWYVKNLLDHDYQNVLCGDVNEESSK